MACVSHSQRRKAKAALAAAVSGGVVVIDGLVGPPAEHNTVHQALSCMKEHCPSSIIVHESGYCDKIFVVCFLQVHFANKPAHTAAFYAITCTVDKPGTSTLAICGPERSWHRYPWWVWGVCVCGGGGTTALYFLEIEPSSLKPARNGLLWTRYCAICIVTVVTGCTSHE